MYNEMLRKQRSYVKHMQKKQQQEQQKQTTWKGSKPAGGTLQHL